MARCRWFTPIILATQETEIRRIIVRSQPQQIVCKTLSCKKPFTIKGWWGGSRCRPPVIQNKRKGKGGKITESDLTFVLKRCKQGNKTARERMV
jgi:hypothetical protein